jgi:hypothetical protein
MSAPVADSVRLLGTGQLTGWTIKLTVTTSEDNRRERDMPQPLRQPGRARGEITDVLLKAQVLSIRRVLR